MFLKPLNLLNYLLENVPVVNTVYNSYRDFLIKKVLKKTLNTSAKKDIFVSFSGETLTFLNTKRSSLIEKAINEKKSECNLFDEIDLYPIYLYLLESDSLLAEMFKSIIEDEYDSNPNAISAYNIIYRDSEAFRNLETEVFNEILRSRELLHNQQ